MAPPERVSRSPDSTSSLAAIDIDAVVRGFIPFADSTDITAKSTSIPTGKSRDSKKDDIQDISDIESVEPPSSDDQTRVTAITTAGKRKLPLGSLSKHFSRFQTSSTAVPSLGRSGPTDLSDIIRTPGEQEQEQDQNSDPSTITHVSKDISHFKKSNLDSSSSQLPYSSPLQGKLMVNGRDPQDDQRIVKPKPVRNTTRNVANLEAMVAEKASGTSKVGGDNAKQGMS